MTAAAVPKLALTVNGSREAQVMRGWPIIVSAALLHPAEFGKTQGPERIVVTGSNGPWTSSIRLGVRVAKGAQMQWPLQSAGSAPAQITLQKSAPATAEWFLTAEQTTALPEGAYELVAVLQAPNGVVSAPAVPVELVVRQPLASLDIEQQADLRLLNASYHFTRGDPAAAGAELDRLLATQPAHVTALALKAELLASQNRLDDAIQACRQAIDAYFEQGSRNQPPDALLALQRDLLHAASSAK